MIMTTRKLMRFMPEADKLDGNIWAWIVPVWDVFSEFRTAHALTRRNCLLFPILMM